MAEYTYKDIIIDPNSEEAKNAIGKKCYMYDSPTMLLKMANSDDDARTLESIDKSDYPFNDKEFGNEWTCIIVKKEETYEELQAKWLEENNIKVGDYMKVTRKAENYEDGWSSILDIFMNDSVGKVLQVRNSNSTKYGIELTDYKRYPYFVLEKVEEPPKPKYVPFESAEEFVRRYTEVKEGADFDTFEDNLFQCGMWLKCRNGYIEDDYIQITRINSSSIQDGSTWIDWGNVLRNYTFLDGTPCGKLEVKDE